MTQPNPEALREAIKQTRKMTSQPFGVNITLLPSINPPDYEGYARAAVEEGVRIFETAGNNRVFSRLPQFASTRPAYVLWYRSWSFDQIFQISRVCGDSQMYYDSACTGEISISVCFVLYTHVNDRLSSLQPGLVSIA